MEQLTAPFYVSLHAEEDQYKHSKKSARFYRYSPDASMRQKIAQRLDLDYLVRLDADIILKKDLHMPYLLLDGRISAIIKKICVISLKKIEIAIDAKISMRFLLSDKPQNTLGQDMPRDDDYLKGELELLGLIEQDQINITEVIIQQLSLEIPDFPRSPDVEMPRIDVLQKTEEESPFQKLELLRPHLKTAKNNKNKNQTLDK